MINFVQYLIHFGLTGIFQNSASQDTCLPCASGKFSAVGSIACATCLAGNKSNIAATMFHVNFYLYRPYFLSCTAGTFLNTTKMYTLRDAANTTVTEDSCSSCSAGFWSDDGAAVW